MTGHSSAQNMDESRNTYVEWKSENDFIKHDHIHIKLKKMKTNLWCQKVSSHWIKWGNERQEDRTTTEYIATIGGNRNVYCFLLWWWLHGCIQLSKLTKL